MRKTLFAAAVAASAIAAGAAIGADIPTLEKQLEDARREAPLVVESFGAVKEPAAYYGKYEKRGNTTYASGADMFFYGEPKNLVTPRGSNGMYKIAFAVDLQVTDANGKTMKMPNFEKFNLDSRSRIQDLYLNLRVQLTNAPPGKYNVKFTLRDQNSKKTADIAQDVTIK